MNDEDLTIIGRRIGYSDSIAEAFGVSRLDRRRHLYAQGKTGSGKSTLLISMIAQDLARGEGVCLIDPLGHIAEAVLSYVPRSRTEQVRYLNVADLERPVGLNILAGHHESYRHRATAAMVDAFSSIWDLSLSRTPQLLDVLGYAVAALTEVPGATLLCLSRFLTDKGYRERLVETHVTDLAVRAYWRDDFGKRSPREQREMCASVLNKANELRRNPVMRNIFGQEHNKLDIPAIIANRDILIVNLAKSEIGVEYARLIGAFVVSQITLAAAARMQVLARCVQEDPQRAAEEFPDFYVYADEFQDLATARFDDALSQSRNGRVSFALFNQFQAQLSE
jgi:DNA helicase HerA-like ATPase